MDIWSLLWIDLEHRVDEIAETLRVLRARVFVLRVHDGHRN